MCRKIFLYLLLLLPACVHAQDYEASVLQYREGYKMSLMKGVHPLKPEDTSYLRFYAPDSNYRVRATFEQYTSTVPFTMNTKNGGVGPSVKIYGILYFRMNGSAITLYVFRIVSKPEFRVLARAIDNVTDNITLFIPFTDNTTYKGTFGGGRYLDVSAASLATGSVILDFNKACNPHTAYEKGYPYVVAPLVQEDYSPADAINSIWNSHEPSMDETTKVLMNAIHVEVKAGEKKFGHNPGY